MNNSVIQNGEGPKNQWSTHTVHLHCTAQHLSTQETLPKAQHFSLTKRVNAIKQHCHSSSVWFWELTYAPQSHTPELGKHYQRSPHTATWRTVSFTAPCCNNNRLPKLKPFSASSSCILCTILAWTIQTAKTKAVFCFVFLHSVYDFSMDDSNCQN